MIALHELTAKKDGVPKIWYKFGFEPSTGKHVVEFGDGETTLEMSMSEFASILKRELDLK